jgi:protoheme IX farnesyltransferase
MIRVTKPRVTALVLITAAGGVRFAGGQLGVRELVALVALALVVSAACTLNSWIERDSDRQMERTRDRPLPSGKLAAPLALAEAIVLAAIALPALAITGGVLAAALATLALVSYVAVYTPLKRRSPWALVVGAVPGALPPLIGATIATRRIEAAGLALFAILFAWQVPHFLAIALYRRDEYACAGLRPLSVTHGETTTRRCVLASIVVLFAATLVPAWIGRAGDRYATIAIVSGGALLALAAWGVGRRAGAAWARAVFLVSLAHLTMLVAALAIDLH